MMRKSNETVMVGKALFLQKDILAKDVVIHIIDSVLVPTSGEHMLRFQIFLKLLSSVRVSKVVLKKEQKTVASVATFVKTLLGLFSYCYVLMGYLK